MTPFYTATDPKMEALQVQLLRSAASWQKMQMLSALNASARRLAYAGLRQRLPNANEDELRRRLADLLLGPALAQIHQTHQYRLTRTLCNKPTS